MSNIFWLILLFPCLLWIPNFFVEETKLGSLESFVARLGERQQRGCVSVEGRQGFWVKRWCCRCGESVCIVGSLRASVYVCVYIVCGWYGHSMNISILVDVACCMHGEKATLHVEYWWSWCARKTWGYCFCSICVSGPLLYTCTGGARVTVYASISIDSSKHTHIFCVCVVGFFYVSASCVYIVIVLASWLLIYELQHILMARSTYMLCVWYCLSCMYVCMAFSCASGDSKSLCICTRRDICVSYTRGVCELSYMYAVHL